MLETSSIESMRNGNTQIAGGKTVTYTCSIESMRNGNGTIVFPQSTSGEMFNRIYEEWKQYVNILMIINRFLFNRIYEEWKHTERNDIPQAKPCSIESVRSGNKTNSRLPRKVIAVQSNLWGMETWSDLAQDPANLVFNRIYEEWKPSVTTWNKHVVRRVQSNLWGMETFWLFAGIPLRKKFNRIYEEWKQLRGPVEQKNRK